MLTNPENHLEKCKGCLREAGKVWDVIAEADRREGMCPKRIDEEVFFCEKTREDLLPLGKIRSV